MFGYLWGQYLYRKIDVVYFGWRHKIEFQTILSLECHKKIGRKNMWYFWLFIYLCHLIVNLCVFYAESVYISWCGLENLIIQMTKLIKKFSNSKDNQMSPVFQCGSNDMKKSQLIRELRYDESWDNSWHSGTSNSSHVPNQMDRT